jgi:hypothetical protein
MRHIFGDRLCCSQGTDNLTIQAHILPGGRNGPCIAVSLSTIGIVASASITSALPGLLPNVARAMLIVRYSAAGLAGQFRYIHWNWTEFHKWSLVKRV